MNNRQILLTVYTVKSVYLQTGYLHCTVKFILPATK